MVMRFVTKVVRDAEVPVILVMAEPCAMTKKTFANLLLVTMETVRQVKTAITVPMTVSVVRQWAMILLIVLRARLMVSAIPGKTAPTALIVVRAGAAVTVCAKVRRTN
jgi:hypothetical protein